MSELWQEVDGRLDEVVGRREVERRLQRLEKVEQGMKEVRGILEMNRRKG
jgi:hypothetical protein